MHLNLNPWWPLGIFFSHSWHRTSDLLMIMLCFCVWWGLLFNQFVHWKKNCVHSWTIIINELWCYNLTLILSGHHTCIFPFHGIEFIGIVNVFIFWFFCVWCDIFFKQFFYHQKLYVCISKQSWSNDFLCLTLTFILGGH